MINFIRKIFSKKVDSLFAKIQDSLLKNRPELFNANSIVYFIDSFIYTEETIIQIDNSILDGKSIAELITGFKKDLKDDIIELYWIQNGGESYLVSLFDPYDYFTKNRILKIWSVNPNLISSFKKVEKLN